MLHKYFTSPLRTIWPSIENKLFLNINIDLDDLCVHWVPIVTSVLDNIDGSIRKEWRAVIIIS